MIKIKIKIKKKTIKIYKKSKISTLLIKQNLHPLHFTQTVIQK
jgi:hypothetical protein